MTSLKLIRILLACSLLFGALAWLASGSASKSTDLNESENIAYQSGDYI